MWRRLSPRSWYRNLVVWLGIGGVAVASGVAVYTYSSYQRAATELVIERDQQVAILSSARLRAELTKFSDLLLDLSRGPEFTRGDVLAIQQSLAGAGPRLAVFDGGVIYLDTHGVVRAYQPARREILGEDWSDRDYFRAVLASMDVTYSNAVMDGPQSSLVVAVAVPVRGQQSQLVGVLVGYFQLGAPVESSLYASMLRLRIGEAGRSYILDGAGRTLFDTQGDAVGHYATPRQLQFLRQGGESGALRTYSDEGAEVVAAYSPVPGTSWTLVTEDDWNRLTGEVRRYGNVFLLSLAAALLVPPLGLLVLRRQRRFKLLDAGATANGKHIAEVIQRELTPSTLPTLPGWTVRAYNPGSAKGSHVFHDAHILPDGRLMLSLGRVNETGVHAAIALATTRATLRSGAQQGLGCCEVLRASNQVLAGTCGRPLAVSCATLIVEPETGRVEYATAGEPAPMFSHRSVSAVHEIAGQSQLGESLSIELSGDQAELPLGSCMLMMTQPAAEATNPAGETFHQACLPEAMRASATGDELVDRVLFEFEEFTGHAPGRQTDFGLLALRRTHSGEA